MTFRLCLLFFAACQAAIAADGFTAEERQGVDMIKATIVSECRAGIEKYKGEMDEKAPPVARWLTRLIQTQDYCTCSSERFGENITPEILRKKSNTELMKVAEQSGAQCLVPPFKSTFGSFCGELVEEVAKLGKGGKRPPEGFCGCVQQDIDRITPDNFMEFVSASTRDQQEFKRTGKVPEGSSSIISSMVRCGLEPPDKG